MAHQIATSDSVKQLFQSQLLLTTSLEFFSQLIPHCKNEIMCRFRISKSNFLRVDIYIYKKSKLLSKA